MRETLPTRWWFVADEHKAMFVEELLKEVGPGHALYGLDVDVTARRDGSDDYLFHIADGRYADVHLTFRGAPEPPPWPATAVYATFEEWKKACADDE